MTLTAPKPQTALGISPRRRTRINPTVKYVLKRLAQSALTIFLTLTTVFVLIRMAPGDPAYALAGPLASTEDLAQIRADMGLDKSVFSQYLIYLWDLVHLNLGTSYSFQAPAMDVVLGRLPYTITLAVSSILLTAVLSIPLGVWMARHADTRRELGANVVAVGGQSMPEFWSGPDAGDDLRGLDPSTPGSRFHHMAVVDPAYRHHRHPSDRVDLPDGSTRNGLGLRFSVHHGRTFSRSIRTRTHLAICDA
ncbi:peptide/nickel transport system permease protein [Rhodococcus erythropolis]|uniref:Peptide/nickel transport system permease protein n=1 Tax=Rhodococcus erythropolis TaxID=1833 RepID=A0A6G9CLB3_RHOER|nr:peptide/nickel transport system permease protein [Rhodococcus erythropolis]